MDSGMSQGLNEGSEYYTPVEATSMPPEASPSVYSSSPIDSMIETQSEYGSIEEFEMAASRDHWSQVGDMEHHDGDDSIKDNLKHFELLKMDHCLWGFKRQYIFDEHNLVVGKKIAEGGQAEIYEAESDLEFYKGLRLILKVFKADCSLQALQQQWPHRTAEDYNKHSGLIALTNIKGAVLLKEERLQNRFAFVMKRMWGDLRTHIDWQMMNKKNQGPPYSLGVATWLMSQIVLRMIWLEKYGVLHRDLKAANVLVEFNDCDPTSSNFQKVCLADFECSLGVVGTMFWRAPEILQQLKDKVPMVNVKFTTKADLGEVT